VEKVNPDLVARDGQGRPYTVRYEAVNAMLLNEFLKEHRKNEEQEATITELKAEIATLSLQW
jgi:cell division protein FtsB